MFKANLQKQYERATVAVKIIPETETKSLDHEIRIMTKLKHKNIVQIIGYCYIGLSLSLLFLFPISAHLLVFREKFFAY